MTTLEEIERMARESIAAEWGQTYETTYARFILSVLPVVRAADVLADINMYVPRGDYAKKYAMQVLLDAITAMRAGLEK